jgi:hypothetical protein
MNRTRHIGRATALRLAVELITADLTTQKVAP